MNNAHRALMNHRLKMVKASKGIWKEPNVPNGARSKRKIKSLQKHYDAFHDITYIDDTYLHLKTQRLDTGNRIPIWYIITVFSSSVLSFTFYNRLIQQYTNVLVILTSSHKNDVIKQISFSPPSPPSSC